MFALGRGVTICGGFWWTPEGMMSSHILVSGVSWSLWQVKAPHGAGAGGMCVPAAAKVCFPVLLHYFSGAEGVLDVPDQAVSSRLSIKVSQW